MIKIEVNEGNCSCGFAGDFVTISAETMVMIGGIYKGLKEVDKDGAEHFKNIITNGIETVFMDENERHELAQEASKKILDMFYSMFSECGDGIDDDIIEELRKAKTKEME